MKAISLFSGMGGDSLGMQNAGFELVAYSEKERTFRETHDLNFKNCVSLGTNVGGDITKIPDTEFIKYENQIDLMFAGFPCFVKGTRVLTNEGYVNIENVTVSMKLMTHTGNFRSIVNLQRKIYSGVLCAVSYHNHNRVICTEEHPFYIRTMREDGTLGEPEWKPANTLTGCDYCGTLTNYTGTKSAHCIVDGAHTWFAPNSFQTSEPTCQEVYNFEVDKDNSYIVENLIVHNCQGFSQAGKKDANDVRNTLFSEFLRATRLVKPKYIIGENVKGLLTKKMNDGQLYIDVIVSEFEKLGYKMKYQLFKTHKYGVPQKRERLVMIGSLDNDSDLRFPDEIAGTPNLVGIVKFDMTGTIRIDPVDFDMSTIPPECILTNEENDETEQTPHPYLKLKAKTKNESYGDKTFPNLLSFGKRDSPIHCEIIDIRLPAKTIICSYEHQPRLFVPLRNKNGYYLRCLLPDELKQIQGFPADYKMAGTTKQKIVQIGNSVPPKLIQLVAESIVSIHR
jgi:DNA (cytosine-5)-methyltransferase 1